MISRNDLKELLTREIRPDSPILTVYLNVDQQRSVNLNRKFETSLKNMLKQVEQRLDQAAPSDHFKEDAEQISRFISSYSPGAKSIMLVSDASENLLWTREMQVGLENSAHWGYRPYIRPALEARDEFDRFGVILTDRAHARLFIVSQGEIQENREALASADVRRFDASGSDQMRSQMNFQRKSDEHARWHLKNVAGMMERLAKHKKFDRLVLAGPREAVAELKTLLSERLKNALVGTLSIPLDASTSEILEETLRLQEETEREKEKLVVNQLLTAAAKKEQAVIGLESTLEAAVQGRIRTLVYADGYGANGGECPQCQLLYINSVQRCPTCDQKLLFLDDLVEPVIERVFGEGGEVEHVRREAAELLRADGNGVGAILRF